jgi:hypothetical protein
MIPPSSVLSRSVTAQPVTPAVGDRYLIPTAAKSRRVRKEGETPRDAPPLVPGLLLDPDFDSLGESDVIPADFVEIEHLGGRDASKSQN